MSLRSRPSTGYAAFSEPFISPFTQSQYPSTAIAAIAALRMSLVHKMSAMRALSAGCLKRGKTASRASDCSPLMSLGIMVRRPLSEKPGAGATPATRRTEINRANVPKQTIDIIAWRPRSH